MPYYVKRTSKHNPAGFAYTGPLSSIKRAEAESAAWAIEGETTEILASSPAIKAAVRLWDKITHAEDAKEIVTYMGETMTLAYYRLTYEAAA